MRGSQAPGPETTSAKLAVLVPGSLSPGTPVKNCHFVVLSRCSNFDDLQP